MRPLADERVADLYRVRLYTATDAALVAIAEPLVEERSAALAAGLLWERHVAPRASRLTWVEVLDARRPGAPRAPLVVQCDLSRDADGQVQACAWRRVAWTDVARRCGGPIPLAPRTRPLPAHHPAPRPPVAGAPQSLPVAHPAPRWPWPRLPDTLRVFSPQRASDAPA